MDKGVASLTSLVLLGAALSLATAAFNKASEIERAVYTKAGSAVDSAVNLASPVVDEVTNTAAATVARGVSHLPHPPVEAKAPRNHVLIVHGYMDWDWSPRFTVVLKGYLMSYGYKEDEIHVLALGPHLVFGHDVPMLTVDTVRYYGYVVLEALKKIYEETGRKIDIIAHSMGGLDARWAIEKLGGDKYVDDLVTLGTPHQGTWVALPAAITPGGWDMIPISDVIRELNDGQLAPGVEYTAVWALLDECYPIRKWGAMIPEPELSSVPKARNLCAGPVTHHAMYLLKSVVDKWIPYLID